MPEERLLEGILGCPVIKKTRPSHSDSPIQDISVAQAEASSNDELQHADYVVGATSLVCSSALRVCVQRYTLLLNGWGENRGPESHGRKTFIEFSSFYQLFLHVHTQGIDREV